MPSTEAGSRPNSRLTTERSKRSFRLSIVLLPLTGRAAGVFKLVQDGGGLAAQGDFSSPELRILGQPATNVRGGLEWKDGVLHLNGLIFTLFTGTVSGNFSLRPVTGDLRYRSRRERPGPCRHPARARTGSSTWAWEARAFSARTGRRASSRSRTCCIRHFRRPRPREIGPWAISKDRIDLDIRGSFLPGANEFQMLFKLPLYKDSISADIKGTLQRPRPSPALERGEGTPQLPRRDPRLEDGPRSRRGRSTSRALFFPCPGSPTP